MARRRTNSEIARILVDADLSGDIAAAKLHGITDRTIRTYRTRAARDPELSSLYESKKTRVDEELDDGWCSARVNFLKARIVQMERVFNAAEAQADTFEKKLSLLRQLSGTEKIVGELDVAHSALTEPDSDDDGEFASPDSPDTPPEGDASPAAQGSGGTAGGESSHASPLN